MGKTHGRGIIGWKTGWSGFGSGGGSGELPKADILDYISLSLIAAGVILSVMGFYGKALFSLGAAMVFIGMLVELAAILIGKRR
ncbi:MAG TPA: hypothetical protein ENL18_01895 [Thermoplasmatales archaeon]|nr:hypothetical protein [Thermoplasmatales archaeon]